MERVAYTPKEFADLFGRSQTWGYRKIYDGTVKVITEHGRKLIPASEVDKILDSAKAKKTPSGGDSGQPGPTKNSTIRDVLIKGTKRDKTRSRHTPKTSTRNKPTKS